MEKEFIPYEQALALKELGFDEPCLTWWHKEKFVFPYWEREFGYSYKSGIAKDCVLSPLYQQAFRWFRDKYDMASFIQRFQGDVFDYEIKSPIFKEVTDFGDGYFDTYEEAELECLKKLIEIVK